MNADSQTPLADTRRDLSDLVADSRSGGVAATKRSGDMTTMLQTEVLQPRATTESGDDPSNPDDHHAWKTLVDAF